MHLSLTAGQGSVKNDLKELRLPQLPCLLQHCEQMKVEASGVTTQSYSDEMMGDAKLGRLD